MFQKNNYFLITLLFVASTLVAADERIYEKITSDGGVEYSDQPSKNAKTINLAVPDTVSEKKDATLIDSDKLKALTKLLKPVKKAKVEVVGYKSAKISNIDDQHTFWNQRELKIQAALDPPLQKGDSVQLLVDGSPYGKPAKKADFLLYNLNRGTHTLAIEVINSAGATMISSEPITVYIKYFAPPGGN